jgi:hypothetical protein
MVTLLLVALASGCNIHGADTGYCSDPDDFETAMPFCAEVVTYKACVPIPSITTEAGNEYRHDMTEKDEFIRLWYDRIVAERLRHESNRTLEEEGLNELGEGGWIVQRFHPDVGDPAADCLQAFKNYFCWLNYPRCDTEDESLVMCRSACENLHISCGYDKDLWRCGDPEYYYGYRAEASVKTHPIDNTKIWYRYPYPGSPFRDIQGDPAGGLKPVCTPSIPGSGISTKPSRVVSVLCMLVALTLLCISQL